jgi:uncharacterized protein (DUF58 family)
MVTAIREYVQGDAFNRISWTATARLGRLMVKEFDVDPTADVWLILDLQADYRVMARNDRVVTQESSGYVPAEAWLDSTDEYAVTVVSSLARSCLDQGRAVCMIATGAHYEIVQADRSDRAYIKMLEALAVVIADGVRPLSEVLVAEARRFHRNSSLIVVTSSTDPEWVDALEMIRSHRVLSSVVYVEGSSFGTPPEIETQQQEAQVLERIRKARVRVYPLRYGDRIADALRTAGT